MLLVQCILVVCWASQIPQDWDRPLLNAIRRVETGGAMYGGRYAVGDRGKSIGPYQISRAYWIDSRSIGKWEYCRSGQYSETVIRNYWFRHAYCAYKNHDYETLARIHNGGPNGQMKISTLSYWWKIKRALQGYNVQPKYQNK